MKIGSSKFNLEVPAKWVLITSVIGAALLYVEVGGGDSSVASSTPAVVAPVIIASPSVHQPPCETALERANGQIRSTAKANEIWLGKGCLEMYYNTAQGAEVVDLQADQARTADCLLPPTPNTNAENVRVILGSNQKGWVQVMNDVPLPPNLVECNNN